MLKNKWLYVLLFCSLIFSYGFAVGKYEVFPYKSMKMIKNKIFPNSNTLHPPVLERIALFKHFSPKADIVFVGDSLTSDGMWSEFFPKLNVVNRGLGGDKASDVIARFDTILSTEPSKAFLMLGVNDIHQNISVSKILESYEIIIELLMEANIEVFIQSTIQCGANVCDPENINLINKLNEGLSQLASDKDVNFISLGDLSKKSGLAPKYTTDGIHLTTLGYIYWVEKIEPLLN